MARIQTSALSIRRTIAVFAIGGLSLLLMTVAMFRSERLATMVDAFIATPPDEVITTGYQLSPDRWIRFHANTVDGKLRLLSNATVPHHGDNAQLGDYFDYAIDYELRQINGRLLDHARLHFKSAISYLRLPHEPAFRPAARYTETDQYLPAAAQSLVLNLPVEEETVEVRLRLANSNPQITDATVRLYRHERIAGRNLNREWLRMSQRQQSLLTREFIRPSNLITAKEQRELVKNIWQPIGPEGIQGEDFASRKIAITISDKAQNWRGHVLAHGVLADAMRDAVLHLAPGGGNELLVSSAELQTPDLPFTLYLRWMGPDIWQHAEQQLTIEKLPTRIPLKLDAGWLQVRSAVALSLQVHDALSGRDLTPPANSARMFQLDPSAAVEYPVSEIGDTVVRLALRRFNAGTPPEGHFDINAQAEWLDQHDAVIEQRQLSAPGTVARGDLVSNMGRMSWISETAEFIFAVPDGASKLVLRGPPDTLAAVQVRPRALAHQIQVPEDYQPWLESDFRQPVWFTLLPQTRRTPPLQTQAVRIGAALPERDALLIDGSYQWTRFEPAGEDWLGRWLWVPREPDQPMREQALSEIFVPVRAQQNVTFRSVTNQAAVTPQLLFLRDSDQPTSATITVDGYPVIDERISECCGLLRLPPMLPGKHRLDIRLPAGQYWLNYTDEQDAFDDHAILMRRTAYRLPSNQWHTFSIPAHEQDSALSMRLFYRQSDDKLELETRLSPAGQSASRVDLNWTPPHRRYLITPSTGQVAWASGMDKNALHGGQRLLLPLPASAHAWTVSLRVKNAAQAHLSLSRVLPGVQAVDELSRDRPAEAY